ncbi:hypothetical protein XH96_06430 [Bradyrhizobium sp. CCBAU 51765]|nr:hypothetical protein XH96_06430 [Bradyrhizobium sp. CCBAU 51765]
MDGRDKPGHDAVETVGTHSHISYAIALPLQGRVRSATFVAYCAPNALLPACDKARTQQASWTFRSWLQNSPNP